MFYHRLQLDNIFEGRISRVWKSILTHSDSSLHLYSWLAQYSENYLPRFKNEVQWLLPFITSTNEAKWTLSLFLLVNTLSFGEIGFLYEVRLV